MRKKYRRQIARYTEQRRQRSIWHRIVQFLAAVVVFVTTYALILPAITMEQDHLCGLEAHTHDWNCYLHQEKRIFVCTPGENVPHTHEPCCFDEQGQLFCPLTEQTGHIHGETCLDETGALVCTLEALPAHVHEDVCLSTVLEEQLTCIIPEHTHDVLCDCDQNADIETEADWLPTMSAVVHTGNWGTDLAAIAGSQIGYRESKHNFIVESENVLKGYSRYGSWYGIPYGRWDAMFVSFCLRYAGVPEAALSRHSNSREWYTEMINRGWLETLSNRTIQTGDIAFFGDQNGTVQFTAVMTDVREESGTLFLQYVAGDSGDAVAQTFVAAQESGLLGFLPMEQVRQRYEELQAQSTEPTVAATTEATVPEEAVETTVPTGTGETTPSEETGETTAPTESEAATTPSQPTEATLPTVPADAPPVRVTQTVETEHYVVTVSYSSALMLPEGTQLRVTEYSRDSEIFYQRCVQAGYELDWLLNIGFFSGEEELDLRGRFDVVVTGKAGEALGSDVIHFADSGAERITGETGPEANQSVVAFTAGGFSDFGGGVAPAAETRVSASVTLNFTSWNEHCPINFPQGNSYLCSVGDTVTIVLQDNGANYLSPDIHVSGGELVSVNYTCGTPGCNHTNWCGTAPTHTFVVRVTAPAVTIQAGVSGAAWNSGQNSVTFHSTTQPEEPDVPEEPTEATTVPTEPENTGTPSYPNHPQAVSTGNVSINRLRFYNICENGDAGVSALAGCTFVITGDNGYSATVVTGNTPEVDLPADIPDGVYTIEEVSAADGYMRDTDYRRTFMVEGHKLVSGNTIGTFINHNLKQLAADKTAGVEDYNNRIYEVLMSAESHIRMYNMDPVDVLFVVDQSNSMLFPAGLNETGKSVTLFANNGSQNIANMESLGLNKNQVYYILSDPEGTSTVWAVWYDGHGWLYQDASYYAKAYHSNAEGYQDPGELAIFPRNRSYQEQADNEDGEADTNVRSNGGGLGFQLGGGLGNYITDQGWDRATFTIYTASSQYNRLHYLEEALTNMIYELADVNDQNRVTLTEFTKAIDTANDCMGPLTLSPDNVEQLVYEVRHINTSGGTRQDLALKHVYEDHLNDASEHFSGDPNYAYTILITDGAPVRSSGSVPDQLGSPNDAPSTTANSIYAQIKGYAQLVRQKSTLMTVGLGMEFVAGGRQVLQEIATNQNFNCALNDAADLVHQIQRLLFDAFRPKEQIQVQGNIKDQISDSFYPIAWTEVGTETGRQLLVRSGGKAWVLLQPGDWITLDGKFTAAGNADAAGQLIQEADGTYAIQWSNALLSDPYDGTNTESIGWVTAGTGSSTGRTVLATYDGKDWLQLQPGDWIDTSGMYQTSAPSWWNQRYYGQVVQNADGTLGISWGSNANGGGKIPFQPGYGWRGTFYVKAKEDFIGGNVINTNKQASVDITATIPDYVTATKYLDTPTVNVRLLDLSQMNSQVTVYLGDNVNSEEHSPLQTMQYFFDQAQVTKLISDGGNVLNKYAVGHENADGLEEAVFAIRYALGRDLTVDEWRLLADSGTITIPYIYDHPSSRGPVGEFTFRLEKQGMEGSSPDFGIHEATAACQCGGQPQTEGCSTPAETYTLHITYEAYRLGQNGRPEENIHNGTDSPGTEVGTGDTLPTGLGLLERDNIHQVHVIDGAIRITKRFADGITDSQDKTFSFLLHRQEDGTDTSQDRTETITIPAGQSAGSASITFDHLRRGTYTVTEAPDTDYTVDSILVLDTTNCLSSPKPGIFGQTLEFTMGTDPSGNNVIGLKEPDDLYTSYINPVNGIFGEAEFTNKVIVYVGDVPVEKVWSDGGAEHAGDAVWLVLYLNDQPLADAQGFHRLLRLDAAGEWKGSFTVALANKDDRVTNYAYSVREVSQVSTDAAYQDTWHKAIVENDGAALYYQEAMDDGRILGIGNRGYMVTYTPGENGSWTVTNSVAVNLPKTGGAGTQMYTFSGLLLTVAGLMYGYHRRRRKGAGQST